MPRAGRILGALELTFAVLVGGYFAFSSYVRVAWTGEHVPAALLALATVAFAIVAAASILRHGSVSLWAAGVSLAAAVAALVMDGGGGDFGPFFVLFAILAALNLAGAGVSRLRAAGAPNP
jgi:hypothetical protein